MKYYESVLDLIGRTPLVRLNRITTPDMVTVLVKMEQLNPAGSVKDRMAYNMVTKAEEAGLISPGATLVESTSGNTGLGLAMVAAAKGYRCIFTIPDKMSKEKIDMLKAYGAEVIITRTDLDHDHPDSYVEIAKRMAKETPGGFYTDQYYNMDNPEAHYLTTGPEIWADTDGKIDCLVGGIGTGGTISGSGKYLKEQAKAAGKEVKVICPDPKGSIYHDEFYKGESGDPSIYVVEGIGHDFMVGTLDFSVIDEVREISDQDSFITARRLAREEGIFCGGSTGTAVFGALQVAKELGPDKLVVCMLCDSGDRYLSKCFDDDWMKDMGYIPAKRRDGTVNDVLHFKPRSVEFADRDEALDAIVQKMSRLGISQMPVRAGADGGEHMMIHEVDLLHGLVTGEFSANDKVERAAKPLQGQVRTTDPLSKVQSIFDQNNVAVVMENDDVRALISKIDVIEYLAASS
ncbi:MAG: pyridoxal-phosphate dependent enzyme [Gammaproteobacteria bacterium]|nr:pyridoxal-phosphate dependent enzyme [Gammaproteobacteria bacterium]